MPDRGVFRNPRRLLRELHTTLPAIEGLMVAGKLPLPDACVGKQVLAARKSRALGRYISSAKPPRRG